MKSQESEQINNMEKTPWDTFLNKTHALDFVRRIRDEGWMIFYMRLALIM